MKDISELYSNLPTINNIPTSKKTRQTKKETEIIEYIDLPICFDIEAYSFYTDEEGLYLGHDIPDGVTDYQKRAVMWAWGLALGAESYLGRTWTEFIHALDYISDEWGLHKDRRIIIWVHNLSYDFQFFRKYFTFEKVFALEPRKVCYALTNNGLEFRCSYILTGYSVEKVGEHLIKHNMHKLVGSIDYDLPRHSNTELTDTEIEYIEHDCLVVTAHIEEQIEIEKGLAHIPLTKTGYVRRYVRKRCFRNSEKKRKYDYQQKQYRDFIACLTLDKFQYDSCKRAFQGGFTHANPQHSRKVLRNISSLDVVSDYPAQILANLYPVTPPEYINKFDNKDEFEHAINTSCCVFTIHLYNIKAVINYDHYLSRSHCDIPDNSKYQLNNGRIVWCDELTTTITNIDYFIIRKVYKWDKCIISGFITWGWGYLPKPIIESTLYMYEQKTTLKGVAGQEVEYMSLKEMLNSIYGMMVTDPLRPIIPYDVTTSEWGQDTPEGYKMQIPLTDAQQQDALESYNRDSNRFTYYPWGVFITAYARHMLWSAILEFKDDYIYSDTDSIKAKNLTKHQEFIDKYNKHMETKIEGCLKYYGIDVTRAKPKNKSGVTKSLGTWELENPIDGKNYTYKRFKTVGAKRYIIENKSGLEITVSGVNKKSGILYITKDAKLNGVDPFDYFDDEMYIPEGYSGKLIPYYGDESITGTVLDYNNIPYEYSELSYVHFKQGSYKMGLATDYVNYLELLLKGYLL